MSIRLHLEPRLRTRALIVSCLLLTLGSACGTSSDSASNASTSSARVEGIEAPRVVADVVSVKVAGEAEAYRFDVGIESPDLGCHQYANWWEVLSEDGGLLYRRILGHSHKSEQPFVRSGGPVAIEADRVVLVRAYMHPAGYGGQAFRGSVSTGFAPTELAASFAPGLAEQPPLPDGCAN